MPECRYITMAGGLLRPYDEESAAATAKWGVGAMISGIFKKPRNPQFHKKLFSLLNTLYDQWEPQETKYKGVMAQKSFENFRKELIILAGYYDVVSSLKGETRVEAKSISFGSMDDAEFEKLYMAIHNIGMQKILNQKGWTERDLNNAVERLMEYV